jgi:hypothetical protein
MKKEDSEVKNINWDEVVELEEDYSPATGVGCGGSC